MHQVAPVSSDTEITTSPVSSSVDIQPFNGGCGTPPVIKFRTQFLVRRSAANHTTPMIPLPAPLRKKFRLLYADDMEALAYVTSLSLTDEGHTVETVANGKAALDLVTADLTRYDVVMTDHHMPVMDGLELVESLRAISFPGRILVFCSELGETIEEAYQRQKVDCLLRKPVHVEEVVKVLSGW